LNTRHTLIAAAALATLPTLSMSQSAVQQAVPIPSESALQIYGRFDVGVNQQKMSSTATSPSTNRTFVSSDTPWLGFRGAEALGGGWRAVFKMETGFQVDTGNQSIPTKFWNRETFVGLNNAAYGTLLMGSQFTPSLMMTARVDPFMRSNLGAILNMFQQFPGVEARGYTALIDNSVQYQTPVWGGFQLKVLGGATEGVAPYGRPFSTSLEYTFNRFYAAVTYDQMNVNGAFVQQPGATPKESVMQLGATYRFDAVKLHGYVIKADVDGSYGMNGGMVGVTVPVGSGAIQSSYQRRDAKDPANSDAQSFALQYSHYLSKRSTLYVGAAKQNNEGNARFGMWPSRAESIPGSLLVPAGADITGFQVGMRHYF
jgi:GBP family porin